MKKVGPKVDDVYTGDSIRPKLEEEDSVAEDWETDEDEYLSCGVCELETEEKRRKIVKTTG